MNGPDVPDADAALHIISEGITVDPEDIANAIVFAVSQPDHVCINDIMIAPSHRE